jgi:uncharacterized protein
MKERVISELQRIEHEHRVRVLLSVESGSRAWGFASPDSDYDVRFIYVHERDWYLSVFDARDVIEEMLPGDLDVCGWELRKTLRLFAKCNLALNEWLGSPIVYSEAAGFRMQLSQMIPTYFNPIAATHHYRSMADTAFNDNYAGSHIRIKKLFYVLRPLLACRWIEHTRSQPPTEFSRLVAQAWTTEEDKEWIANLVRQKADAVEAAPYRLSQERADGIRAELERYKSAASFLSAPVKAGSAGLDDVLRQWAVPGREP